MSARSEITIPERSGTVKDARERAKNSSDILRGLGRGPAGPPARIPRVSSRLALDEYDEDDEPSFDDFIDDDDYVNHRRRASLTFSGRHLADLTKQIAASVLDQLREEFASLVEKATSITDADRAFCPICSHGSCRHFHSPNDYSVTDVADYLGVQKSTIYTWNHRQEITTPVSENPHLWDPHVIACFKHDQKLVFPNTAVYDRDEHLRLLKARAGELAAKKAATHAKRSAHAVRLNASRKKKHSARTPKSKKSTVRGLSRKR